MDHKAEAIAAARSAVDKHEAEMTDEFVGRYIGDMSVDIGERGERAVEEFLKRGCEGGVIPNSLPLEFAPAD